MILFVATKEHSVSGLTNPVMKETEIASHDLFRIISSSEAYLLSGKVVECVYGIEALTRGNAATYQIPH
ncbi:MAG: hypothetical protein CVT48_03835 [Thermoplasmata archaeon HGW-Thermoplasmata-1]|nr:MAG: hypothetical protein CVT48_03835 [Thermoplasmata archaeon HGW-Thermoplasmata-1]